MDVSRSCCEVICFQVIECFHCIPQANRVVHRTWKTLHFVTLAIVHFWAVTMSYHFCLRLIAWWKSIKKLATLTGSKDFTIPAEPEGIDGICVALELSHHQSMANVPQEDSAISGPWCQKLPIGGKSKWMDGTLEDDIKILDSQMFKQHLLFLAVLHYTSLHEQLCTFQYNVTKMTFSKWCLLNSNLMTSEDAHTVST